MIKKTFALGMMLMAMGSMRGFAETSALDASVASKKNEAKLVAMNSAPNRVNQLERRIDNLERTLHDQNDAIRNLERDISDLRRRH